MGTGSGAGSGACSNALNWQHEASLGARLHCLVHGTQIHQELITCLDMRLRLLSVPTSVMYLLGSLQGQSRQITAERRHTIAFGLGLAIADQHGPGFLLGALYVRL